MSLEPPCFHSPCDVRKVGARHWMMLDHLVFESKWLGGLLVLPKGAIIDFASTPRFLWSILPKTGQYDYGTALHDGGYKRLLRSARWVPTMEQGRVVVIGETVTLTREIADKLMDEANAAVGVKGWERALLFRGTRMFGWAHYRGMPQ